MIELSGEERAELERRVGCYTLPHKVVVRAKMILYAAEGGSTAEIARRLETAPRVVGRWRKRFFEERLAGGPLYLRVAELTGCCESPPARRQCARRSPQPGLRPAERTPNAPIVTAAASAREVPRPPE